jgi:arginine decarboxylase
MEEALKDDVHLETSSAFDIPIIENLHERGLLNKENYIICNGFKRPMYTEYIVKLLNAGFVNLIPVLDNLFELDLLKVGLKTQNKVKIGMRIASEEEPKFDFYTSRLGIRTNDIVPYYLEKIKDNPRFELKMLHFFINTGIKDSAYYWNELNKSMGIYCELKKICPELTGINIGGGFPIKNSLSFAYDYEYMAEEIVAQIKTQCERGTMCRTPIFSPCSAPSPWANPAPSSIPSSTRSARTTGRCGT